MFNCRKQFARFGSASALIGFLCGKLFALVVITAVATWGLVSVWVEVVQPSIRFGYVQRGMTVGIVASFIYGMQMLCFLRTNIGNPGRVEAVGDYTPVLTVEPVETDHGDTREYVRCTFACSSSLEGARKQTLMAPLKCFALSASAVGRHVRITVAFATGAFFMGWSLVLMKSCSLCSCVQRFDHHCTCLFEMRV